MKLAWLSDVHLNFLDEAGRDRFFEDLAAHAVDAWLVSGDIGDARSIIGYLGEFERRLAVPTYFVLGNHDFYGGSLAEVTANVSSVSSSSDRLVWLTVTGPKMLGHDLALVGDDCWSDGRLGNPMSTPVELNDFFQIKELTGLSRRDLVGRLNRLGDESAIRLSTKLEAAATRCSSVLMVTHPPPFEGATWHEGKVSPPDWLPWFSCEAAGAALMKVAGEHQDTSFIVLCGHTHNGGRYSPRSNVTVYTAWAKYGSPTVQAIVRYENSWGLSYRI